MTFLGSPTLHAKHFFSCCLLVRPPSYLLVPSVSVSLFGDVTDVDP